MKIGDVVRVKASGYVLGEVSEIDDYDLIAIKGKKDFKVNMCEIERAYMPQATKVSILGTEYSIGVKSKEDDPNLGDRIDGYCEEYTKRIVICNMADYSKDLDTAREIYIKSVLRHEIVHAFLDESGLSSSSNVWGDSWAKNEEMVDWIAIQAPKLFEAFKEAECI